MEKRAKVGSETIAINSASFFCALTILVVVLTISPSSSFGDEVKTKGPYYGKHIGDFPEAGLRDHYLSGKVYAVDSHRFFIYAQNYDGKAPMAYYWVGNSTGPDRQGQPIRWPNYGPDFFTTVKDTKPLPRAFAYENVLVEMPSWIKISDYRWLSMWCDKVYRSFGHVEIPSNFAAPKPRQLLDSTGLKVLDSLGGLSSGPVTILDSKTILIKDFKFDGTDLEAGFYVGGGNINIKDGARIPLPENATRVLDEFGRREGGLKSYAGKDLTLTLPPNVDLFDVDWLSLYSKSRESHFALVNIPKDLRDSIPPHLNALAIGYAGSGGLKGSGIIPIVVWAGIVTFVRNFWTKAI